MEARTPKPATLRRYGLTLEAWEAILQRQGGVCAVCKQLPKSLRLCVDHFHERGWKKKPPEERAKAVRGLLCWRCNTTYVGRGATVERALNVAAYLSEYAARKAA